MSKVGKTRAGRRASIESKKRHTWRQADKHRPKFGLKPRVRLGGVGAVHRVDAAKNGRVSRLTKVARAAARKQNSSMGGAQEARKRKRGGAEVVASNAGKPAKRVQATNDSITF